MISRPRSGPPTPQLGPVGSRQTFKKHVYSFPFFLRGESISNVKTDSPAPPESSRVIVHLKILQKARLGGSEL